MRFNASALNARTILTGMAVLIAFTAAGAVVGYAMGNLWAGERAGALVGVSVLALVTYFTSQKAAR